MILLGVSVFVSPAKAEFNWCSLFGTCPPARDFVPVYAVKPVAYSGFSGASFPMNPTYFADEKTANKVCSLIPGCNGLFVIAPPTYFSYSTPMIGLRFAIGDKNAGFLAKYWDNYPDNVAPGAALRAALADLGR